jgi:hypothetical protein
LHGPTGYPAEGIAEGNERIGLDGDSQRWRVRAVDGNLGTTDFDIED